MSKKTKPTFELIGNQHPDGPTVIIGWPNSKMKAHVAFDWWSGAEKNGRRRLQIGIGDTGSDECSVWVRFNDDGTIHSVELDREVETRISSSRARDEWRDERDKERTN